MVTRLVGADNVTGKLPDVVITELAARFPSKTASYTKSEADSRFAPIGAAGGGVAQQRFDTAGEALAAKLEMGAGGDIVMALLSDSTGGPDNGWYRLWAEQIAVTHPKLHVDYRLWDDASQAYAAPIVLQAGTGYVPATGVSDSFNRTATSLNQQQPEVGGIWNGPPGVFSLNGSRAVVGASVGEIVSDGGVAGSGTAKASGVIFNMTPPASGLKQFKVFPKYLSSTNHIYLLVQLSSTGVVAWQVLKRINGTVTVVFTGENFAYTANADNTLEMSITISGLTVTASINEKSGTGQLVQADLDALASATLVGLGTAGATVPTGLSVDSFSYVPEGSVSSGQKLTVYNGTQGGTTFAYQAARLAKMIPVRPDVVFLSSSHNYLDATATAYMNEVTQLVSSIRSLYPSVGVTVSSQNPRFTPAVSIKPHAERLVALRILALQNGWGYLPVYEAYSVKSDGGQSLVLSDGVHPNTEGRVVWYKVATNYLAAKSLTPVS